MFKILQKREGGLSAPGCHLTVYPVELPSWLPHDISEALLERFNELLTAELERMLQKYHRQKRGRVDIPSQETSPASSIFNDSCLAFQSNHGPIAFPSASQDVPASSSQSKADKHSTLMDMGILNGFISTLRARFTRK